jgi:hypothetical protein
VFIFIRLSIDCLRFFQLAERKASSFFLITNTDIQDNHVNTHANSIKYTLFFLASNNSHFSIHSQMASPIQKRT